MQIFDGRDLANERPCPGRAGRSRSRHGFVRPRRTRCEPRAGGTLRRDDGVPTACRVTDGGCPVARAGQDRRQGTSAVAKTTIAIDDASPAIPSGRAVRGRRLAMIPWKKGSATETTTSTSLMPSSRP